MSSLMLINPRKRKSARSPAQKAATRRMLAARHGGAKRRKNPIAKRRTRARTAVARVVSRVKRRSKRRSNPSLRGLTGGMGGMGSMLMNSLKGAGGAVLVNVATNYMPAAVKQGKMVYVTRAVIALLIGTVGKKVLGNNARVMAEGALVVNTHDFINAMAGAMLPGSGMHGVGEYISAGNMQGIGETMPHYDAELNGMNEYLNVV
jgi:hypothetical protein